MKTTKDKSDQFLKDLVQKTDLEKPSLNFTQHVMKAVEPLTIKNEESVFALSVLAKRWYLAGIAGIVAIVSVAFYLVSNHIRILSDEYDPLIFPVFKKVFSSFRDLFHTFQVSSFTLIIIGAILLLILIDLLLRKIQANRQTFIF